MKKQAIAKNKSGYSATTELQHIITRCRPVLVHHHIQKAGVFGSYARGEQTTKSDVDILVQLPKGKSLFDLVGLELDLKVVLRKDVDVVTYRSLHPLLKKGILKEEVRII